jgi:hypothetical protein
MCPVSSFLLYLEHLHPDCDSLWARPNPKSITNIWYYNSSIGVDKLGKFMKELSVKYQLSSCYSNHSIRVTGATILTRNSYAASQIKDVTGHRSVSSLAIYQRVSDGEKMQMAQSLSDGLGHDQQNTENKPELQEQVDNQIPTLSQDLNEPT